MNSGRTRPTAAATLLLRALADPTSVSALDLGAWERLLRAARQTRLLARLECLIRHSGTLDQLPPSVQDHLHSAATVVRYHQRRAQWELNRLHRVLSRAGIPFLLVKGSAYLALNLDLACGREMRDIDLLIHHSLLERAEAILQDHHWGGVKLDEYDQQYYRRWMHELPPMRHPQRVTEVDLHHAILPPTARIHPDPERLFAAARPIALSGVGVLSAHDMLLHMVVHLFYDGALDRELRDLIDIDALLRHSAGPGFWDGLVDRAQALELQRPLFYALRYTTGLLDTPIPEPVTRASGVGRPNPVTLRLMDVLVPAVLLPADAGRRSVFRSGARWLLYLRSHWLRMPPLMLARHLFHKGAISSPRKRPQLF